MVGGGMMNIKHGKRGNQNSEPGDNGSLLRRFPFHSAFSTSFSSVSSALSIVDRMTIAYLAFVIVLVVIRQEQVKHSTAIALIHLALIALIVALSRWRPRSERVCGWLGTVRRWYPTLMFGFFFEEIGFIVHAIHPGWFDHLLIAADYSLFGVHPTVWIEQYAGYWMTEWLQLAYTSYLLLTIGVGFHLWRKNNLRAFDVLVVSTATAYYLGYLIFVLFPIESPHHTLAHLQTVKLEGGPFTALIDWIERYGRVHGGAFPSAHVSGATVALICAWRYARRWGIALTPLVLSIYVATVYGRYHYVVDVFAGILMAVIGVAIGARVVRRGAYAVSVRRASAAPGPESSRVGETECERVRLPGLRQDPVRAD